MALGWHGNDDMRWIIRHLIQKQKENETASATAGAAGVFATRPLDTCGRVLKSRLLVWCVDVFAASLDDGA